VVCENIVFLMAFFCFISFLNDLAESFFWSIEEKGEQRVEENVTIGKVYIRIYVVSHDLGEDDCANFFR